MLKLSYLNYYIGIFSTIASSRKLKGSFSNILFIDAFGGSGLIRVKGTRHTVLGSSLLASLNDRFDKIVSFEIDSERAAILRRRLEILAPGRVEVIEGDVNAKISEIVSKYVNRKTIALFFIDPEGMEPEFSEMKCLIDKTEFVDTMMNYTWGVYRLEGRINKSSSFNDIQKMQRFLPTYVPGKTPDDALIEMFEEIFGKPYGDRVDIKSSGGKAEYSMILRIRKTKNETIFIEPMRDFGKIISKVDGDVVCKILETIKGQQGSLQET